MKTEIKITHPSNIWARDKKILRSYNPNHNIDWNAPMPTNDEAVGILIERTKKWENPQTPLEVNANSLETIVSNLVQQIEDVWKGKFTEKPAVEIASSPNDYLFRINMLAGELNSRCGFGLLFDSPPTIYTSQYHGVILIPRKFIVRVPKDKGYPDPDDSLGSSNFRINELEWDKQFIEGVLADVLSQTLFRQIRGEWKQGYVDTSRALGFSKKPSIDLIKDVLTQYGREELTLNRHPDWGLYTVADKFNAVWKDKNKQGGYLAVMELAKEYPLHTIALIDDISLTARDNVKIKFFPKHPAYQQKVK